MKSISIPVFLLISFFLVQSLPAQVQYGNGAETIVNDLLEKGISSIGELNLKNLKQELKDLKWEVTLEMPPEQIAWGRRSAYYLKDEKKILITQQSGQLSNSVELRQLELHEALGVLGYRDHNYSQTSALILLHQVTNESHRKQLVKTFGKSTFSKDNLKSADGGSSVGGGGDSAALMVKLSVLDKILKNNPQVSLAFYPLFAEINFEPISGQYIEIEYHLTKGTRVIRGAPKGGNHSELLTIKFPEDKIDAGVLNKISEIIISLVPTDFGVKRHRVSPEDCDPPGGLTYPQTDNYTILFMQIERTSFLLNCANETSHNVHIIDVFKD